MKKLLLLCTLVAVAACEDQAIVAPLPNPAAMVPPGTVQVIIAQERGLGGDTTVFVVRLVANGVPLAAYQGSVTFVPEGMQIISVLTPENAQGEFRVVNAEGAAAGKLRFAGFATEAMSSTEAFRIVARLHGNVSLLKLDGSLDIAGEAAGTQIGAASLRRSIGVYDASTNAQLAP